MRKASTKVNGPIPSNCPHTEMPGGACPTICARARVESAEAESRSSAHGLDHAERACSPRTPCPRASLRPMSCPLRPNRVGSRRCDAGARTPGPARPSTRRAAVALMFAARRSRRARPRTRAFLNLLLRRDTVPARESTGSPRIRVSLHLGSMSLRPVRSLICLFLLPLSVALHADIARTSTLATTMPGGRRRRIASSARRRADAGAHQQRPPAGGASLRTIRGSTYAAALRALPRPTSSAPRRSGASSASRRCSSTRCARRPVSR